MGVRQRNRVKGLEDKESLIGATHRIHRPPAGLSPKVPGVTDFDGDAARIARNLGLSSGDVTFALVDADPDAAVVAMKAARTEVARVRHPEEPDDQYANYVGEVEATSDGARFNADLKDIVAYPEVAEEIAQGLCLALVRAGVVQGRLIIVGMGDDVPSITPVDRRDSVRSSATGLSELQLSRPLGLSLAIPPYLQIDAVSLERDGLGWVVAWTLAASRPLDGGGWRMTEYAARFRSTKSGPVSVLWLKAIFDESGSRLEFMRLFPALGNLSQKDFRDVVSVKDRVVAISIPDGIVSDPPDVVLIGASCSVDARGGSASVTVDAFSRGT